MHDDRTHIHTATGRNIDLANFTQKDVVLDDILLSLSKQPRFNGHTIDSYDEPWTVLHHSYLVYSFVRDWGADEHARKAALLHDAHEAYVGDIPTPVKTIIGGDKFDHLLWCIDVAIAQKFNLGGASAFQEALVKKADQLALVLEAYTFLTTRGVPEITPLCFVPNEDTPEVQALKRVREFDRELLIEFSLDILQ